VTCANYPGIRKLPPPSGFKSFSPTGGINGAGDNGSLYRSLDGALGVLEDGLVFDEVVAVVVVEVVELHLEYEYMIWIIYIYIYK
jgi:hypothetical protein